MFNVEVAIANWRKKMLSSGIKAPVPLDELEQHLREELAGGCADQKTFDAAIQTMGDPRLLRSEFKKVQRSTMKRKIMIAVGVVAFFIGTSIVLPALAQHKQRNVAALAAGGNFFNVNWATDEATALTIGCMITLAGIGTSVYAFKSFRKAAFA